MNATNNVPNFFLIFKVYVVIKIVIVVNLHIKLNVLHAKQILFYMKDNVAFQMLR